MRCLPTPTDADSLHLTAKTRCLEVENQKFKQEISRLKKAATAAAAATLPRTSSAYASALQVEIGRLKEALARTKAEKGQIASEKSLVEAKLTRTFAKFARFRASYVVALQECKMKLKDTNELIETCETRREGR